MKTPEVITNLLQGYLFKLNKSVKVALNRRRFPDEVREQFAEFSYTISDQVSVKRVLNNKEWIIVDGDQEFSAIRDMDSVMIYDLNKVMSQQALANEIGVSQKAISDLASGKRRLTKEVADALVEELWLNDEQANVVMIASARDTAAKIQKQSDDLMVELHRLYSDYPKVMVAIKEK